MRRDLDRMVELAEDGVRRAPPGTPTATEAHFWAAIAWGVWGMAHGNLASAFQGVAVKIRDHAEVRAADERYRDAAGLRLLGRLHTKVPRMPLVSGWAHRGKGIELLRRAYAISRADRRNALFLGQALLTYRPKEKAEALALLREVACAPIPEAEIVEVSEQVRDAKGALREAGAPFDPAACQGSEPAP